MVYRGCASHRWRGHQNNERKESHTAHPFRSHHSFALDVIAEGQLATFIPVVPSAAYQDIEGVKRSAYRGSNTSCPSGEITGIYLRGRMSVLELQFRVTRGISFVVILLNSWGQCLSR